jgi:alkanesulfonate monooxygenase SsuD/methylene tetrahydromethanopterin reductase-like flavin-dependent oxidoreductase (luciferase family)
MKTEILIRTQVLIVQNPLTPVQERRRKDCSTRRRERAVRDPSKARLMPRICTVCNHRNRQAIEEHLLSGEAYRGIAKHFSISAPALFRHKTEHLLDSLQRSHAAADVLRVDSLVDHVKQLRERTEILYGEAENILIEAKRAKDLRTALAAIREAANVTREARGNLTLLGQLTGELQPGAGGSAIMIVVPCSHSGPVTIEQPEPAVIDIARSYGH